eukprot:1710127-Ditylum_brightwellii.AAC.1
MLYLAIPLNLLLWGCETWALKVSDWKCLQVFRTSAIRHIFNINMHEVHDKYIQNKALYSLFQVDPMDSIVASRQLRWI